MSKQLTSEDFRESLNDHVAVKGAEIHARYGPKIGWKELLRILADRSVVRYPSDIIFASGPLLAGEFAHAAPNSDNPQDGFKIYVHPFFSLQREHVPHLVLYQLVLVNYGPFATADDAETFGATALGLSRDEYYAKLCELADQIEAGGPA